jgi:hypothetical protein
MHITEAEMNNPINLEDFRLEPGAEVALDNRPMDEIEDEERAEVELHEEFSEAELAELAELI